MHPPSTVIVFLLATFISNISGLQVDDQALDIADIPPCGITCLLITVPAAGCSLTDASCQCASQELAYSTAACMLANCTMADSLGTAKVQAELCNLPHESKSAIVFASLTAVFAVVCTCVALRMVARILTRRVNADDYFILTACLLSAITYACACAMVQQGFGQHLWSLQPGQLQVSLRYFYICWNLYVITLGLVKISLLVFYLEVFQGPKFRIICYIVLGYTVLSTIVIQFLTIFSCTPIQSFWNRDIKGVCLDIGAIGFANSANAILQDLIILILPMPSVLELTLKRWRKAAVTLMFAVGAFGCITTMIRLRALSRFRISIDPTWEYTEVTIWTGAELSAGIACASLPAIRQLLIMMLPKRFHSLRSQSAPGSDREVIAGAPRQPKRRSLFALPSLSEHDSNSYGTESNSSSKSWTKWKSGTLQDEEYGIPHHQETKGYMWLPLKMFSHPKSRSFQTSFWSSVDRAVSPPLQAPPLQTRYRADLLGVLSPNQFAERTGKVTSDDQVELLQIPEAIYPLRIDDEEITALPRWDPAYQMRRY